MSNTTIQLKKSATPTAVPSNLANGELAINYADGKLFYKAANGTIAAISGAGGSGANTFATMNANGTLVVADSASDVLSFISGNNISIVGDAVNDSITIGLKDSIIVPGDVNVVGSITVSGTNVIPTLVSAFNQANTANAVAVYAANFANSINVIAVNAYNTANAAASGTNDLYARTTANLALSTAQSAFTQANAAPGIANS